VDAREAVACAEQYARPKYVAVAETTLGLALLELGRPQEAVEALRLARRCAEQIGHPPSLWRTGRALATALAAAGDDGAAAEAAGAADAEIRRFADALTPERRPRFLERVAAGGAVTAA
jgi:hypothetical protein